MTQVKIKKLNEKAIIPEYKTPGSAAIDLCACLEETFTIEVGETALIPTGFAIQIEEDVTALIFARSGLASKNGISLANSVGVIDSDYRGEIKVAVVNRGKAPYEINHGDRIAQMGFFPVLKAQFELADELDSTERGEGGFGHTGIK